MSQADELLDTIAEEVKYAGMGASEEHIIIGRDRFISVPESLQKIAVQYDHNAETVTFDCPRYWDEWDMSTGRIYVNYMRPDGIIGSCLCENVAVDEEDDSVIHFDWTVSKYATMVNGDLRFLVCAKNVDSDGNELNHWNTELNDEMHVSEGLEVTGMILEQYPDIVTQLLVRMDEVEKLDKRIIVGTIVTKTINPGEQAVVNIVCKKDETDGQFKVDFEFSIPQGEKGDMPEGIVEKNTGKVLNFFLGTHEEWEAYDGDDKASLIFVPIGQSFLDDIDNAFDELADGTRVVAEATHAVNADTATSANYAASAGSATTDGEGNNIADTYVKKSGNSTSDSQVDYAAAAAYADEAGHAVSADSAVYATEAESAENADRLNGWFQVPVPTNDSLSDVGVMEISEGVTYIRIDEKGAPSGAIVTSGYTAYCVSGVYFDIPCDMSVVLSGGDLNSLNVRVRRAKYSNPQTSYIEVYEDAYNGVSLTVGEVYKATYYIRAANATRADRATTATAVTPVSLSLISVSTLLSTHVGFEVDEPGIYDVVYSKTNKNSGSIEYHTDSIVIHDLGDNTVGGNKIYGVGREDYTSGDSHSVVPVIAYTHTASDYATTTNGYIDFATYFRTFIINESETYEYALVKAYKIADI